MDDRPAAELIDLLRRAGDAVAVAGPGVGRDADDLLGALRRFVQEHEGVGPSAYARSAQQLAAGIEGPMSAPHPIITGWTSSFPALEVDMDGPRVAIACRFGPSQEGPPGMVHGGFVAAGFDVAVSLAASTVEPWSMTRRLQLRFLRPAFLGDRLEFEAEAERGEHRSIHVTARLRDAAQRTLARATAEFVTFEPQRFADRRAYRPPGEAPTAAG